MTLVYSPLFFGYLYTLFYSDLFFFEFKTYKFIMKCPHSQPARPRRLSSGTSTYPQFIKKAIPYILQGAIFWNEGRE